jgi:type IV secretory pathway VirB2 component (pilin)
MEINVTKTPDKLPARGAVLPARPAHAAAADDAAHDKTEDPDTHIIVAGDAGTAKTTFLNALLHELANSSESCRSQRRPLLARRDIEMIALVIFAVILALCFGVQAQDIPIARVTEEGSGWVTGPFARAAAGVGVAGTAIGLGFGEGGSNLKKAGWASLCFTGAVVAARFVEWFATGA